MALETEFGSMVYCCWAEVEERRSEVATVNAVKVFMVTDECTSMLSSAVL